MKKIKLDSEALNYISAELNKGFELSQRLRSIDLNNGEVFTYSPLGFEQLISDNIDESIDYLTNTSVLEDFNHISNHIIYQFLRKSPNNIAIFETYSRLGDPKLWKHQYFTIGNCIYRYLLGENTKKTILDYQLSAAFYPGITILSENFQPEYVLFDHSFTETKIQTLLDNVSYIIVVAFDAEGYVFWKKKGNSL